jgi:hypothetical protein
LGGSLNISSNICVLRELVAALDRRRPQLHRAGEAAIVRDAMSLRSRALERIDELEGQRPPPASP